MREKPILFSNDTVLALLADTKSMTRRVILPQPAAEAEYCGIVDKWGVFETSGDMWHIKPKYYPGDTVWVQEAWQVYSCDYKPDADIQLMSIRYRSDGSYKEDVEFTPERFEIFKKYVDKSGWQSPYYMPKEAARLRRRIGAVHAEHISAISEQEAKAEGVQPEFGMMTWGALSRTNHYSAEFRVLWDKLNEKRGYGWQKDPWVWVYKLDYLYEKGE